MMADPGPKLTQCERGFSVRIRYGKGERKRILIPLVDPQKAKARAAAIQAMATALVRAGKENAAELLLSQAGDATEEKFQAMIRVVAVESKTVAKVARRATVTFADLAESWVSGELHRRYPDHVKAKRDTNSDRLRLARLCKVVGDVPIDEFTLDHAERAMASLPADITPATRRAYGQALAKLLKIAAYPCRLRGPSPIPAGFLPSNQTTKAFSYLRPTEDAQLMACTAVPLLRRVLWGFLAREGMRLGEALALTWGSLDLSLGAVRLDKNKTDDPRAWALDPSVAEVLRRVKPAGIRPEALVFTDVSDHMAELFRGDLEVAGIDRAELFERSDNRVPIRVHDLRATFVTLSLAGGKSETWVADRTGHRSTQMISRYRREARTATELNLGELAPLLTAIPEFTDHGPGGGPGSSFQVNETGAKPLESLASPRRFERPTNALGSQSSHDERSQTAEFSASDDAGERTFALNGPPLGPVLSPEQALAFALSEATKAGQWDVVARIVGELQARRMAHDASNGVAGRNR